MSGGPAVRWCGGLVRRYGGGYGCPSIGSTCVQVATGVVGARQVYPGQINNVR
jgi:hypothetical protein